MSHWWIELVTNDVVCNTIELDAEWVEKTSFKTIIVDGIEWTLPDIQGMTFAEIVREACD